MIRKILTGFLFLLALVSSSGFALSCGPYPNTLTNGTNADASQVMANFTAILNCVNGLASSTTPQGRLTLVSGTPVMATTMSAATTLYYTPYHGNFVPIYDGTNMNPTAFAEVLQATTDATKSPAAVAASKVYDVFCWIDSGTNRCTRGPAWTSDTSRGYTLTMVNGILLNTTAITNGPAASRGTYVGTIRSNASSQIDYIFGGSAAGGTAAFLGVWNAYNRVDVTPAVTDQNTWTYSGATVRQADNSAGNRISFVSGLAEDGVAVSYNQRVAFGVAGQFIMTGFALDSMTTMDKIAYALMTTGMQMSLAPTNVYAPQLGFHFIQATEAADGTNTATFVSGAFQSLSARLRM
jgi:hypothetical protein